MALSFFRRRQKMVVIIMAFLMVSFLIGPKLAQMGRGCRSNTYTLGTALGSDITIDQKRAAGTQLERLQRYVGLGNPYRNRYARLSEPLMEMHAAMSFINVSEDPGMTFLLLAREADAAGVKVTSREVDRFFDDIGLDGEHYANRVAEVREDGLPEKRFRALAAKWLAIYKTFTAAVVDVPPSIPYLKLIYRDLNEKIKLRILRISAEDMLKDVPADVSEQAIVKQFNSFRNVPPGRFSGTDSFGFAYRQPNRVSIGYLLIDGEVISRVTRPSDKQVREYYLDRPGQFTRRVAIPASAPASRPAASRPSSRPRSAPASAPTEYKSVEKTVAEAMPEIRKILTASMTESRMDSVTNIASSLLAGIVGGGASDGKDYERVLARMIRPADSILDRTLKNLDIKAEPLDRVVAKIARAARVEAICYPWGSHGRFELSRKVLVTLQPKVPITLREALKRITRQAFGPATAASSPASRPAATPAGSVVIKWAMCKGFNDVLFPLGGDVEMFPLKIGATPLMTYEQLRDNEMLAACSTSARDGRALIDLAFQAREFLQDGSRRNSAIEAGKDGPRMVLLAARRGRMLWRPLKAVAAHTPEKITPELRKQIIGDLRIKAAYDLAENRAQKILAAAAKKGIEAVAKNMKLKTFESAMFSRKKAVSPRMQLLQYAAFAGRMDARMYLQASMTRPIAFVWNRVGGIELPTPRHGEYFMEQAFSLTPDDIDRPVAANAKPAVVIFPLPVKRQLFLLERIGYEPAVAGDFRKKGRQQVADQLLGLQRWESMVTWFNLAKVKVRTGFVAKAD